MKNAPTETAGLGLLFFIFKRASEEKVLTFSSERAQKSKGLIPFIFKKKAALSLDESAA